jgi:hypothetical protein
MGLWCYLRHPDVPIRSADVCGALLRSRPDRPEVMSRWLCHVGSILSAAAVVCGVPAERRGLALVRDRLWRTGVQWRVGDHPADSPPICGWPCAQVGCFPPICCTASSAIVRSRSGCGSKPSGARMPRYRVQRAFPDGLQMRLNETGVTACLAVVVGNLTDRISARVAPRNPAWPRVAHASVGR